MTVPEGKGRSSVGQKVERAKLRLLSSAQLPNIRTIRPEPTALQSVPAAVIKRALFQLETIRRFEEALLEVGSKGLVHGPVHSSIGQEATAVGVALALDRGDTITSTHRAHHHFLAKALAYYEPDGFDPVSSSEADAAPLFRCVRKTFAEILGLAEGWQRGRGGSMHLHDRTSGVIGTSAIVGGGIPIAAGAALAEKYRGTGRVSVAFFGDGACSIGSFHEGISMARVFGLPAIFFIENNLYSVATTVPETVGFEDLILRATGYDMLGLVVDGMDPIAVMMAVQEALRHIRESEGPVMIEAKTYRYRHQSGPLPGSAYGYRTKDEERQWLEKDPLQTFPQRIQEAGLLSADDIEAIRRLAHKMVEDAVDACVDRRDPQRCFIPDDRWADPATVPMGVRSAGHEFVGVTFREPEDFSEYETMTFVQAVSAVQRRWMEKDPDVFIMGEEVGHLGGGAYGGTREPARMFPERVLSTPICELGFTGVALGAALMGLKPIVEYMYADFGLVAADQLFNHIAKVRHMYGGDVDVPLVVRSRVAPRVGYGAQHSSDPSGLFAQFPGWRIVAPSSPAEYIGLFNAAMMSRDPVLVLEHFGLYPEKGEVPKGDLDYVIPLGKAKVKKQGRDVTVLTWASTVGRTLAIAEELEQEGISAEVIDLRTIDLPGIDYETIAASVRKTNALVIVEDAFRAQGVGMHIAEEIQRCCFDDLDHPVLRVASKDIPVPVSKRQEAYVMLSDDDVRQAIVDAARRQER